MKDGGILTLVLFINVGKAQTIRKSRFMRVVDMIKSSGFPQLLETLEKPGIYFGSLNPGNSLELCVKTLNPVKFVKKKKHRSTQISFFFSLNFILFCHQLFFRKIIDTSLECCIDQTKSWNKWEKLLEIVFTYNKVIKVFQKDPWKCAVDSLITLEIPLNFPIWNVWEPRIFTI